MKVTLATICQWLILLLFVQQNTSKKILGFFPIVGKSQQNVFVPILYELAKRGHEVVYLTPVKPDVTHPNMDVRLIPLRGDKLEESIDLKRLGEAPPILVSHIMSKGMEDFSEFLYGDAVAQDIIHSNDTYDAVLMESYFLQEPVSALLHKFGCIAIEVSSLGDSAWINELSGLPDNPSFQIDWRSTFTDSMTFFERLYNSFISWSTVLYGYYHLWRMQGVMDKYFNYSGWESRPPLNTLVGNRSLILINRDIALDYPYPLPPHVKEVGGVHIMSNKPLPKDLQNFMDNAVEGVIYFSLGTHLRTSKIMNSDIGKAFIPVLGKLTQKILIKWEINETIDLPTNFKTYKWIPQQAILAHKNCVLFITHGGLLSLTEAVYFGVPVIGIPHFGDQPKNMIHAQYSKYGVQLKLGNITQASASWAIQEVLNNPRYKEEITKRSKFLRDKRHTAVEEAVYWVEYAIKYPNVLTPKGAYLNFFQLHMIDITLFWVFLLIVIYILIKNVVATIHNLYVKIIMYLFFKPNKEKLN